MLKFLKEKRLKLELLWMRKYWETADLQLSDLARDRLLFNLGELRDEKIFKVYSAHRESNRFKLGEVYDHLLKATSVLDSAQILDTYCEQKDEQRLPIETIEKLTYAYEMTNCIFEFHALAGHPKLVIIDTGALEIWGRERLIEFSENLSKTVGDFDFDPSHELLEAINKHWKNISGSHDRAFFTSILMLRAIYGETDLIELLDRVTEDGFETPLINFPKFLDNWSNLREYPLSWSEAMA